MRTDEFSKPTAVDTSQIFRKPKCLIMANEFLTPSQYVQWVKIPISFPKLLCRESELKGNKEWIELIAVRLLRCGCLEDGDVNPVAQGPDGGYMV